MSTALRCAKRNSSGPPPAFSRSVDDWVVKPLNSQRSSERARQCSRSTRPVTDPAAQYSLLPTHEAEDGEAAERAAHALEQEPCRPAQSCWEQLQEDGVELLDRQEVQIGSAAVILLNAIAIGLETDHPDWSGWDYIENIFLLVFTVELIVRLTIITPVKFFACKDNPEFIWNCFDFSIVSMGLVDVTVALVPAHDGPMGFTSVFRIIRLCRILRMFRIIRFLKQLYLLAYGFVEATLAIVWVTVLMTFVLYVCGIVLARLYGKVPKEDPDHEFLAIHFGTVPGSMLTLFMLMASPDLAPFMEVLSNRPSMMPFLIVFIIFGSFGMIALLTGVISECMFEKNKAKNDEERLEREARRVRFQKMSVQLFNSMDTEQTGSVACEELIKHQHEIVELLGGAGVCLTPCQLVQMCNALDTDSDGKIDHLEFENGVMQMCEDIRPMSIMELHNSIRKCSWKVEATNKQLNLKFVDVDASLAGLAETIGRIYAATVEPQAAAGGAAASLPVAREPAEAPGGAPGAQEASAGEGAGGGRASLRQVTFVQPQAVAPASCPAAGQPPSVALEANTTEPIAASTPLAAAALALPLPPPAAAVATAQWLSPAPLAEAEEKAVPTCQTGHEWERPLAEPVKGLDWEMLATETTKSLESEKPRTETAESLEWERSLAETAESPLASTSAPPCAVLEDFRRRLQDMAQQLRAEISFAEATGGRVGELLALQLDGCSSALGQVITVPAAASLAAAGSGVDPVPEASLGTAEAAERLRHRGAS